MHTEAIILKKQNTNEYDQLITCYTKEFGKITAIAKSILKSSSVQRMHLDQLNLVDFELITGRGVPIIAGAQCERVFSNIKKDMMVTGIAHFFVEVVDKLVPEMDRDDSLWDFLADTFNKLDMTVKPESALAFFRQKQFYLLQILGYAPMADTVASTGGIYEARRIGIDKTFEYALGSCIKSLDFIYSLPAGRQVW